MAERSIFVSFVKYPTRIRNSKKRWWSICNTCSTDRSSCYTREERRRKQWMFRHGASSNRWNDGVRFVFRSMLQLTAEKIEQEQKRDAHSRDGWPDRFIAASAGTAFSFSLLFPGCPPTPAFNPRPLSRRRSDRPRGSDE